MRKQIKGQVLRAKAESHRLWLEMNANRNHHTELAFKVEYSVYWRLWHLYRSLFFAEPGPKPKRIEHYVFVEN